MNGYPVLRLGRMSADWISGKFNIRSISTENCNVVILMKAIKGYNKDISTAVIFVFGTISKEN